MWFEGVLNVFSILEESDGYKLIHTDAFYIEEIKGCNVNEELFVKRVYPWGMVGVTIVSIVLFGFFGKGLELLVDFL